MKPCRGPLDHPSRPGWTPPALACDSHCHVFGPFDRFPLSPERSFTPPEIPWERLRALHDLLGFERCVLVQASCHGSDNSAMLDAIARSGGRARGVAIVGPGDDAAAFAALHAAGVRGVRFNFVAHLGGAPDMGFFWRTVEHIAPLGWHLQLHFDAQDIPGHAALFERIPLPFVIDHMGRVRAEDGVDHPVFRALLGLLERNPRAWVKVSGSDRITPRAPFDAAAPFARALCRAAPERTLWGTDFPHPNLAGDMPDDGALVDLFARTFPDAADRQRILVDNPARLYWGH